MANKKNAQKQAVSTGNEKNNNSDPCGHRRRQTIKERMRIITTKRR